MLGTLVVSAGVITSCESAFGVIDRAVVTEFELQQHRDSGPHPEAEILIAASETKSICRWLDARIAELADRIREMESTNADPTWVAEKQALLDQFREKFKNNKCTSIAYI